MNRTADIVEVFSGIQGEGICVGRRQVFVRFAGCNLACAYCDTPESRGPVPLAQIESAAGSREFRAVKNPVTAADLAGFIARLDSGRSHDSVSLTGGEPLLAADFIAELIPLCGGRRFYLETNGTLPRELRKLAGLVHVVAMDIKLGSATGQPSDLDLAREFLSAAAAHNVFVKVVVTQATGEDEVCEAAGIVASVDRRIPLVIQPVTPTSPEIRPPGPERLLVLQAAALRVLDDVRVIPQVHKLMGQK